MPVAAVGEWRGARHRAWRQRCRSSRRGMARCPSRVAASRRAGSATARFHPPRRERPDGHGLDDTLALVRERSSSRFRCRRRAASTRSLTLRRGVLPRPGAGRRSKEHPSRLCVRRDELVQARWLMSLRPMVTTSSEPDDEEGSFAGALPPGAHPGSPANVRAPRPERSCPSGPPRTMFTVTARTRHLSFFLRREGEPNARSRPAGPEAP